MDILDRVPDPSLFDGLSKDMAEKWATYLYVFPKDTVKKASLKTRTYALYAPQAKRDKFPASIRCCMNTYGGCPHRCKYCYVNNYIVNADKPREKEGLLKKGIRDIKDMKELGLSAVPLHISNSTDPLQERLEIETKTTFKLLRVIADNREQFTTVTILTKNPLLASYEPYLSVLKAIEPCQVEVSLIFNNDETRAFYEPDAPTVQSRLDGIRRLRDAGIKVSLRIDPLMPREPLPKPF
jgi:DNA repair photolyase